MLLQSEHLAPLQTQRVGFGSDHEHTLALYRQALRSVPPTRVDRRRSLVAGTSAGSNEVRAESPSR
ncbi:MAG: hypothetical protein ACR2JY_18055 [Chloroflexota bacterium]